MTENTQTTAERVFDLILSATQAWTQDEAAEKIAAEIDALTAERDEARAEVERLRPAADAWLYKQACEAWDAGKITPFEFAEAHKLYSPQARRARATKVVSE